MNPQKEKEHSPSSDSNSNGFSSVIKGSVKTPSTFSIDFYEKGNETAGHILPRLQSADIFSPERGADKFSCSPEMKSELREGGEGP